MNTRLCTKKTFSAFSWRRMWSVKRREGRGLDEEAKREEGKSGKSEVKGERERVEIKRRCLDPCVS